MRSIRARVLVLSGIAIALTFIAAAVVVYVLARAALYNQFDGALTSQVQVLASQVELDEGAIETEIPVNTDRDVFELWSDGRVITKSAGLGARDLAPDSSRQLRTIMLPDGKRARQVTLHFAPRTDDAIGTTGGIDDDDDDGDDPQPANERPDDRAARPAAAAVLVLARPLDELEASIHGIANILIIVGLGGTLLSLLLLALVTRFALAPIHSVAEAIATIKADALELSLTTRPPDELRPIVDRLHDAMARLAKAFARERQLTAEVAHELRTPLAGLRATIEVVLDRDRPAERYRAALADCLAITKQTESTVQALLLLAKLDANAASVERAPVDVDVLVREAIAGDSRITASLPPTQIETDATMLRVVVHNLVDNAVTYCNEGGRIDIELDGHTLTVKNTGCTLEPADAAHVFQRFWRKDAARTSGHAGLGLPLCRRVMDVLGGTIDIVVADGTFTATVRF